MGETERAAMDALPGANRGLPSEGKDGSTSRPETARTYSEAEHQEAITKSRSDALAEAGRRYKQIEEENAALSSQLSADQELIEDNREKMGRLEQQIDELAEDDPDKTKFAAKLKVLEKTESDLKAERQDLEKDKSAHAERNERAERTLREVRISEVAGEYEGGNPAKLKDLCEAFSASSEEQIRKIADHLWNKLSDSPPLKSEAPAIKPDSGMTNGGGIDISKLSSTEKIRIGLERQARK